MEIEDHRIARQMLVCQGIIDWPVGHLPLDLSSNVLAWQGGNTRKREHRQRQA